MTTRRKFAFIVHPRAAIARDLGRVIWKPLSLVPDAAYNWLLRYLPLPPLVYSNVYFDDQPDEPAGYLILVPVGARHLLKCPRSWAAKKVEEAVDKAVSLGAEVVGLGGLTAPVTGGGKTLRRRQDVAVTNGNAFTAYMVFEAVRRLLPTGSTTVAIVGATGSTGSCTAHLLAEHGIADEYLLVARNELRLGQLKNDIQTPGIRVTTATDMQQVRNADLVIVLTSAMECLLQPEHLKKGAVILDATQPRNTSPDLLQQRPDVRIVDGGLVSVPGARFTGGGLTLPKQLSFACMAETMLLALAGHDRHFSLGRPTVEQAKHAYRLSQNHRSFGFNLAPFHCFGRPIAQQPLTSATLALA